MAAKTLAVDTVRLEDLLARSGAKDRTSIEKHLAACDAEPDRSHSKLWRRLATRLGALAPLPCRAEGMDTVLFYVPDGKYRMQVFALEDRRDGVIQLYLPNVLAEAVRKKLVSKSGEQYTAGGAKGLPLSVLTMDAANTPDPPQHVKHMIGWNRKALRMTLNTTESNGPAVEAAESLCTLAATQWAAALNAQ
jgi:hypothetical protein